MALPNSQQRYKMEALRNLEEKCKIKTPEAILIFLCTAFAVVGLCAVAMLKRMCQRKHMAVVVDDQDQPAGTGGTSSSSTSSKDGNELTILEVRSSRTGATRSERDGGGHGSSTHNWMTIRRVLMSSARWSEASKWDDGSSSTTTTNTTTSTTVAGSWRSPEMLLPRTPLLGLECDESSRRRQSHNSASPVWQRPILMGEKCELPRFSGLILYDERGRLLDHSLTSSRKEHMHIHNYTQEVDNYTVKEALYTPKQGSEWSLH